MKVMKWVIISAVILLSILTGQTNAVINTCQKSLGTASPKVYRDCTAEDPDKGSCCYVSVKVSSTNTVTYCAYIPGAYVKTKSISEFQRDIPYPAIVECSAGYIAYSLLVLFVIFISLL